MTHYKELEKLGYKKYSNKTIEELDNLPFYEDDDGEGDIEERLIENVLVLRWFRNEHKLHSTITSISQESWQYHITKPGEVLGTLYEEDFYFYEEAEYYCIEKLIEILKNESIETS